VSNKNNDKKIIVALDKPKAADALALASLLDPALCRVKVGKELFTSAGPSVVEALQKQGFEVFLDLKFHDIPNTVASAVKVVSGLGVWMLTLHAAGGERMMAAAHNAAIAAGDKAPLLVAVTVLTSMDQSELASIGVTHSVADQVQSLAALTAKSGCDGVVCSALEAELLGKTVSGIIKVTPGIRLAGDNASDQRRVMTPAKAVASGADYLVIGRSITGASSPADVLMQITDELKTVEVS